LLMCGALAAMSVPLGATRLVEIRPVDEQVLMVHFRDGEILYRDDGSGPSARWTPSRPR